MKRDKHERGIFVELLMQASLDRIWQLTQKPELHQRWDLRFDRIRYLPRAYGEEQQRFLYETRIGFGFSIKGTGETVGQRAPSDGDTTSALKFASDDPKSLIRQGSGYWRYVPTENGLRFFTWYDYQVRFGACGRFIDHVAFRPLIGWATAWSFDRLRLWADEDQSPENSMTVTLVHAIARLTVALIWVWHGLVPKVLFHQADELVMLQQAGISADWVTWIGCGEIAFGVFVLATWRLRGVFIGNAVLMILATIAVAVKSPTYLEAAFNPVTLNLSILALSVIGWIASRSLPTARRCLRAQRG